MRAVDEKGDVEAGVRVAHVVAGVRKMFAAALKGRNTGRKVERFIVGRDRGAMASALDGKWWLLSPGAGGARNVSRWSVRWRRTGGGIGLVIAQLWASSVFGTNTLGRQFFFCHCTSNRKRIVLRVLMLVCSADKMCEHKRQVGALL